MNDYALNGSTLNGAPFAPLAGSATFDGYVNVAATGTRVVNASATCDGYAGFTATGLRTAGVAATIDGYVDIVNNPKFIQAASATFDLYGDLRAAVYRAVQASAQITCYADFVAIPASKLGSANITPTVSITATGTCVQPGAANASAGSVDFSATGKVTRYVAATINPGIGTRVEAQVNRNVDGFALMYGYVDFTMPDVGIVLRQGGAAIDLKGDLSANGTYITAATATVDASADLALGILSTMSVPDSVIDCYADFSAQATRTVLPAAAFPVSGDFSAKPKQTFAGAATFDVYGDAGVNPVRLRVTSATVDASADFTASAVVLRMVQVNLTPQADVALAPIVIAAGAASVNPSASVAVAPTRMCLATIDGVITPQFTAFGGILNQGVATFDAAADSSAAPKYIAGGAAKISCTVAILAGHTRVVQGQANFTPSSSGSVAGRLNVEAIDPPERTFYRPALDNELIRPFVDTELRRYA